MKRFIEGECHTQTTFLPESIGDYISDTNPVRIVDVFVDELDLGALGFEGMEPAITGRPAQDLHLRLPEPHSVQPAPGKRSITQRRTDVADKTPDTRLQDHRSFPSRQR
jgi:hypothetical protein